MNSSYTKSGNPNTYERCRFIVSIMTENFRKESRTSFTVSVSATAEALSRPCFLYCISFCGSGSILKKGGMRRERPLVGEQKSNANVGQRKRPDVPRGPKEPSPWAKWPPGQKNRPRGPPGPRGLPMWAKRTVPMSRAVQKNRPRGP